MDDATTETADRRPRPRLKVQEAAARTGLSVRTVQRRVDAWIAGDRSDYALRGGRAGSTSDRYVDESDVDALARQLSGDAGPGRHVAAPPDTAEGDAA